MNAPVSPFYAAICSSSLTPESYIGTNGPIQSQYESVS